MSSNYDTRESAVGWTAVPIPQPEPPSGGLSEPLAHAFLARAGRTDIAALAGMELGEDWLPWLEGALAFADYALGNQLFEIAQAIRDFGSIELYTLR